MSLGSEIRVLKVFVMLYIKSVATSHMRLFTHKLLINIKQDLKFSSSNPMWLLATVLASIKTERFHGCWDALPGSVALEQWLVHAFLLSILQLLHLRRLCQLCEGSWLPHVLGSSTFMPSFAISTSPSLFSPSVPDTAFQSTSQTWLDGNLNSRCPEMHCFSSWPFTYPGPSVFY